MADDCARPAEVSILGTAGSMWAMWTAAVCAATCANGVMLSRRLRYAPAKGADRGACTVWSQPAAARGRTPRKLADRAHYLHVHVAPRDARGGALGGLGSRTRATLTRGHWGECMGSDAGVCCSSRALLDGTGLQLSFFVCSLPLRCGRG